MEKLQFITAEGVVGLTVEWDCDGAEYDAQGWLVHHGDKIGKGTAMLPSGGWIDLSQFAAVIIPE